MPDETPTKESQGELPLAPPAASAEELTALRAKLADLEQKTQEYERLLTSPEYIQYMAATARGATHPQREATETDFDGMSNKDLAAYLSAKTSAEVTKAVKSVQDTVMQVEVRRQIDLAKAAHPDFETYRPRMIELCKKHQSLNVEEAYTFAKAEAAAGGSESETKAPAPKPKPATKTEAPSNTGRLEKPVKGFVQSYNKAWDEVVGAGKTTT